MGKGALSNLRAGGGVSTKTVHFVTFLRPCVFFSSPILINARIQLFSSFRLSFVGFCHVIPPIPFPRVTKISGREKLFQYFLRLGWFFGMIFELHISFWVTGFSNQAKTPLNFLVGFINSYFFFGISNLFLFS